MPLLEEASAYTLSGLSVIACDITTKAPIQEVGSWKSWQTAIPARANLEKWFYNGAGIGVIGGPVSGNLEMIDFDDPTIAKEWVKLLKSWNCQSLVKRLVIEQTQRSGHHVAYRHQGKPDGNKKLAFAEDGKALIETRGEGGYCLVAPTPGYVLKQGSWTDLPMLTADEREALLSAARTFCKKPIEPARSLGRVGDDYNERASIDEVLIPLGWERSGKDGWIRPGKKKGQGISATWNHNGNRHFCCFTSSTELEPGNYDLFGLYARLVHGGDFGAATRAAMGSGYGYSQQEYYPRPQRGWEPEEQLDDVEVPSCAGFRAFEHIEKLPVEWLWHPYIPFGGLSILVGNPGIGKSSFAYALASMVSNGTGGGGFPDQLAGDVLLYCLEDDSERVIKGKLEMNGADMRRIYDGSYHETENPEGIAPPITADKMRAIIKATEGLPDLKLVIFDPVVEWFPAERSMNTGNEVREVLRLFRQLSERRGIAVLLLGHPNKSREGSLIQKVSGSIDFSAVVRSGLFASKLPETEECALIHFKQNWGPPGQAIGYQIEEDGAFCFTGSVDVTEDMLNAPAVQQPTTAGHRESCKAWILDHLANGPMNAKDVFAGAKLEGFSSATVKRAKQELGTQVSSRRHGDVWSWFINQGGNEYDDPFFEK